MRRLLAFLALLSGLTAIGASPQASALSSAASEIAATQTTQSDKRKQVECRADRKNPANRAESSKECKQFRPVVIFIPTVQMGSDRAYE